MDCVFKELEYVRGLVTDLDDHLTIARNKKGYQYMSPCGHFDPMRLYVTRCREKSREFINEVKFLKSSFNDDDWEFFADSLLKIPNPNCWSVGDIINHHCATEAETRVDYECD